MTRWLKAYGRPRQKVMIIAGLGHVMCHPAKGNHPRDGRTPWDGSHPQHHNHPRDGREVRDGRTKGNGYKNGLDFIITFVVTG